MNNRTNPEKRMGVFAVEKRKHPRYAAEFPLDYSRIEEKETYGGMVANVSEGGLLVYLPQRLAIGELLKIEILYVQGLEFNTIKAVAKIVWSDFAARESYGEYRYGLQFVHIEEADYNRLIQLLKEIGK
ncbi:MAG: PilZ domain-containing protein [Desulfobacterota bacterium]|nr:PilZ domain-containing protein [Thermodesulfobacteriota bacterium]